MSLHRLTVKKKEINLINRKPFAKQLEIQYNYHMAEAWDISNSNHQNKWY